jgi:hypothetical protein
VKSPARPIGIIILSAGLPLVSACGGRTRVDSNADLISVESGKQFGTIIIPFVVD